MKIFILTCLLFSSVLVPTIFCEEVKGQLTSAQLIDQLSSDSYSLREEASKSLWEKGSVVIPELTIAADGEDPEAALRASEILDMLELGMMPDSPKEIFALIEAYRGGGREEKRAVLEELKKLKAYRQLLVLFSKEEAELKQQFSGLVQGVAIAGAREAIFRGEETSARELLQIDLEDPTNLMALASLAALEEKRDVELFLLSSPVQVPSEVWQGAILRAKGDIKGATKIAGESGQEELYAVLKMLQGDPTFWIQRKSSELEKPRFLAEYELIASKKWSGNKITPADFQALHKAADSPNDDERERAMLCLALLGELEKFESFQEKSDPTMAFVYYLNQERVAKALEAMGLNSEAPNYKIWFEKKFTKMVAGEFEGKDDFDPALAREIAQMAGFLEERGMNKELTVAILPFLNALAAENEARFLEFLETFLMRPECAPEFSIRVAAEWAGEDKDRWEEVNRISLKENEEVQQWHDWIKEMKPEQSNLEALQATRAFLGIASRDPENLRAKWNAIAWEAINRLEGDERKNFATRVLRLAIMQRDVETSLQIYDLVGEFAAWRSLDRYLSAAGRWKEAAKTFASSQRNIESSSPEVHAFLAANYRRAGMQKEAAIHDKWVEKLTLGVSQSCMLNARYYSYGGDYERAELWKRRAVEMADFNGSYFVVALDIYAKSMMDAENWAASSACYEAVLHNYASQRYPAGQFIDFSKIRLKANFTKALSILGTDRERAIGMLESVHKGFVMDGILADDFFPIMRKVGLVNELEALFSQSWKEISEVIEKYPGSINTRNTAAWLASRAQLKLEQAEKYLAPALEISPNQPAYLDTMAEIQFAKGNRKGAIEWSNRAVMFMPQIDQLDQVMIRQQNDRFKTEPLPK